MNISPKRGQIWEVNFDPTIGAEIEKLRPAIVVNTQEAGRLPLCIVVPITDWKTQFENFFWFVHLPPSQASGLYKESGADCFQVKSISINRFIRKLGRVTEKQLEDIACAITLCVGYHE